MAYTIFRAAFIGLVSMSTIASAQNITSDEIAKLLRAAEQTAKQARENAAAAQAAAQRADQQLSEIRALLASGKSAQARAGEAPQRTIAPVQGCPQGTISSLEYFRHAESCESAVVDNGDINDFDARAITGVGSTIAAASSGSTATFSIKRTSNYRSVSIRSFGNIANIEQQRVSRHNYELGVRADINKDDKNVATIATFGQLDKLSTGFTVYAEVGRDYSSSEPYPRTTKSSKWSFVSERAEKLRKDLELKCSASGEADCTDSSLVRWIFRSKDGDFLNPDAVKAYNDVFWGPPPVDTQPRFGWSVRGELSRPSFSYFPFALAKVPDPFNPGKAKTAIDPAQFPSDFGSRITENETHANWALTGKAFFHVSSRRAKNYIRNHGPSNLAHYADWETGTTILGTVSYVRKSEIEEPFRNVAVCPLPVVTQAFVTNQQCTTINIAKPVTTDSAVIGAEVRQGFESFWIIPPSLLSARYTHDFTTHENGLSVPLYFADDNKGIFKSGIQFARKWGGVNKDGSKKSSESIVGVVVGVSISLNGASN